MLIFGILVLIIAVYNIFSIFKESWVISI